MEQKGYLTRRQEGRKIIYRSTQAHRRVGRSALGRVLDVFFNGSLEKAVAAYLNESGRQKLSDQELVRLSELIEQVRRKGV